MFPSAAYKVFPWTALLGQLCLPPLPSSLPSLSYSPSLSSQARLYRGWGVKHWASVLSPRLPLASRAVYTAPICRPTLTLSSTLAVVSIGGTRAGYIRHPRGEVRGFAFVQSSHVSQSSPLISFHLGSPPQRVHLFVLWRRPLPRADVYVHPLGDGCLPCLARDSGFFLLSLGYLPLGLGWCSPLGSPPRQWWRLEVAERGSPPQQRVG